MLLEEGRRELRDAGREEELDTGREAAAWLDVGRSEALEAGRGRAWDGSWPGRTGRAEGLRRLRGRGEEVVGAAKECGRLEVEGPELGLEGVESWSRNL